MQISPPDAIALPGIPSLSAGQKCAALAAIIALDPEWAGADVGVVTLPFVGPAVRLRIEDGGLIVQYIVPSVGERRDILATFTCTCPPYARLMTELFDSMGQSLALHYD